MNAEALIGMVLGTCTLQKLIGQGGMGAVYLAQQSRPRRQVAVKVLLPMTPLTPNQQAAFLERFRRETDAAASLEHPNIMPVHEYGERDGLAYLVMPYVSGGTLRDEMEREGALPLAKVVNYLDQMAAALGFAHERGVIHRDIKPANILMTQEGRLLLTDFGLVKIVAEGQAPQARLTGVGVPMGTPDYMAPEQVIGAETDARADLYSLGVILYQMVTGTVPFRGEMPMQIAVQHLQLPPPPPRSLRPDLPVTAEQVMLRALAKNPADRYLRAQDLASAFHLALASAGLQIGSMPQDTLAQARPAESRLFTPRGLFDPVWQAKQNAASQVASDQGPSTGSMPAASGMAPRSRETLRNDIVAKTSMTLPSFTGLLPPSFTPAPLQVDTPPSTETRVGHTPLPPTGLSLGRKTAMLPSVEGMGTLPNTPNPSEDVSSLKDATEQVAFPQPQGSPTGALPPGATGTLNAVNAQNPANPQPGATGVLPALPGYGGQGTTSMMRLTQSMRVVKVPIAGQPGRYVTGLLPVLPPSPENTQQQTPPASTETAEPAAPPKKYSVETIKTTLRSHMKVAALVAAVCLVVLSSGIFLLARGHSGHTTGDQAAVTVTPNLTATATMQAVATAQANIILTDPLNQNAHNWPIATSGPQTFAFKDGAYHIRNNDTHAAIALLPDEILNGGFVYTLDVDEISGNDGSIDNQFGMVLRYTTHQRNGRTAATFYCFDVASMAGGQYQFWKYDDSYGPSVNPWTSLWSHPFGHEYHFGHGVNNKNTFKVVVQGSKFTFFVNGKQVGSATDSTLTSGQIGMLVNLKGTEVAFTNLMLTYH